MQTIGRIPFAVAILLLLYSAALSTHAQSSTEGIIVDAAAPAHPFPHYWEHMFGSGRAILSLRESYRQDLRAVRQITDFKYVRFHAILNDEAGLYDEDAQGHPVYNFSYVDQIYDGLLANGVKPFIELSFMPNKLAASPVFQAFWYKPDVSPPKDWQRWEELIQAFARHLVKRYGIDEVSTWYFEVWNEPNIDFWAGKPAQSTYWQLYDHAAFAIKKIDPRLRIGGPATAQAAWVDAFIEHCTQQKMPVDFVSTHVYGNDGAKDVFGTNEDIPRDQMVCRAVGKVHDQIRASSQPHLPLIWSEFNASYKNETEVTDSLYMGPWLAGTVRQCDGLVDIMSYWTFSDVFEEQGVVKTPFYGGFGLLAEDGIPKPAYWAFALLHKLGNQRLDLNSNSALLTRTPNGSLVMAVWNYAPPGQSGPAKTFTVHFQHIGAKSVTLWHLDADHGDYHRTYEQMGSPAYPTSTQVQQLREAAADSTPETLPLNNGELSITVPAPALIVMELK
ncbi:MAG: glycosyl hydrolase family 39 [Candidatus Sulfotelmatobacter sp.]|jgi:xylan 1,4-beta-xylosidase